MATETARVKATDAHASVTLLIDCLRSFFRGLPRSEGALHTGVLEAARRHGVVPLAYNALSPGLAGAPDDIRSEWLDALQRSAAGSFLHAAELVRICQRLQQQGIRALAFKGPTLAAVLYGKLSFRTIRDLDILVDRTQFGAALAALRACGYSTVAESPVPGQSRTSKHVLLTNTATGCQVELHWAIAEPRFPFNMPFKRLWAERNAVYIFGSAVAAVSLDDLLLILSAHGSSHCWGSLKWVCDFAQAATRSDINWQQLLIRARALGCRRMLLIGMTLASSICKVKLPAPVEDALSRDGSAVSIMLEIRNSLLNSQDTPLDLDRILLLARSRERWRDRIRILAAFVAPKWKPNERDHEWLPLPAFLRFLYVPLHFLRLAMTYWHSAIVPLLRGAAGRTPLDEFATLPPR